MTIDDNQRDIEARAVLNRRLDQLARDLRTLAYQAQARRAAAGEHEVLDLKEQADLQQAADVDDEETGRALREQDAVRRALVRLDAGRYGRCVDCGEPISASRLRALPAASRCTECQQQAESAHRA